MTDLRDREGLCYNLTPDEEGQFEHWRLSCLTFLRDTYPELWEKFQAHKSHRCPIGRWCEAIEMTETLQILRELPHNIKRHIHE